MAPRQPNKPSGKSRGASRGNLSGVPGGKRKGAPLGTGGKRHDEKKGPPRRHMSYSAFEKEQATQEYMARLFAEHEYEVSARELDCYWQYYCLLRKRNAECDLTRIMGIEATVLKHFIDSAIVADLIELEGPVLDIGTGAGFPGAPIAIRKPKLPVILAESRGKRVQFLEELKETLALKNVTIFGRSVKEDSDIRARSIVTRALETIPATLQRVSQFLEPGGKAVFCKGPNCGQEITDAQQGFKGVYKMTEDIRYTLPGTKQQRRLVAFQKREE